MFRQRVLGTLQYSYFQSKHNKRLSLMVGLLTVLSQKTHLSDTEIKFLQL
jgi:hypothetical protein